MAALITDVLTAAVTPRVTNAACRAAGVLVDLVDLQLTYAPYQLEARRGKLVLVGRDGED